jgi:hypothetical protein
MATALLEHVRSHHPDYDIRGLTKPQRRIFLDQSRFRVVVAGRRFGKTILGVTECLYEAQSRTKALIWYIAPTYRMAKELVWEELKEAVPPHMIASKNEAELSITLKGFNSKIVLKGADNPDSLRGKGLDFVVFDEVADITEQTWFKVIYPALTDKQGKGLFIGTPKGYNWFYDLYAYAQTAPNWSAFTYTTAQGGNVTQQELEYAKETLSHKQYIQEFEASFQTLSNTVYSAFDRNNNTDLGVEDVGETIYMGMDFNVNPMSAVIGSRVTNQLHIFDEIEIVNGNTEEMCEEIKNRYPSRKIIICPDPSGKSRKTSAPVGQTDFTIIKGYGYQVLAPNKAPPVVDRINEVNALCQNAKGQRRLFINPKKCKSLIKCLDGLTYKDGTSIPDKSIGLDHMTDALGYLIHMEFPIVKKELAKIKLQGL